MSESYFEITDQEWRSGSLAEDKLDQIQESFNSIGFAVVAGLVPPAICEQLMTAFLEDVELIREKAGLTPHEKHTAEGHLQLGPRRSASCSERFQIPSIIITRMPSMPVAATTHPTSRVRAW